MAVFAEKEFQTGVSILFAADRNHFFSESPHGRTDLCSSPSQVLYNCMGVFWSATPPEEMRSPD